MGVALPQKVRPEAAFAGLLAKPETAPVADKRDSELRRWARGEMRGVDIAAPSGVSFRDLTKAASTSPPRAGSASVT
ncbi:hypothetical protein EAO70_09370 [Streptomyces sp. adm13(2018)]|uniref:hypothetical protein n=1 Tax=Streptomyces sp. adm13(2018) TaxID=2479007 RepID=UPI0011CD953E|nr:hypothetical protein [Streptomyces sp. adm13(2018)]TXS20212.1 hypothetical protein EAO70_09370 [Streptomyces sp. adm13(2018)]